MKSVSKHVEEIALCIKPDSTETKLFKFALACTSTKEPFSPIDHPINSLSQLEKQLFQERVNIPSLKKRRKQARKYLDCIKPSTPLNCITQQNFLSQESKWDIRQTSSCDQPHKVKKIYTCETPSKQIQINNDLEEDAKPVSCKGKPFIGWQLQSIKNYTLLERISEKEIKAIPRFVNYEKGLPSQVFI